MSKEKRMAGSYEIEQSIYIGEKEVLFGVNKAEEYPFMVCYCSYNNPCLPVVYGSHWYGRLSGSDAGVYRPSTGTDRACKSGTGTVPL